MNLINSVQIIMQLLIIYKYGIIAFFFMFRYIYFLLFKFYFNFDIIYKIHQNIIILFHDIKKI